MELIHILPTPVARFKYEDHESIKEKITTIISESQSEQNQSGSQLKHYGNNISQSILKSNTFEHFKDWAETCAYQFCSDTLGYKVDDKIICTDSWVNVCSSEGYQYQHYHANCIVSGTYYVNYDSKKHAPLIFKNPKLSSQTTVPSLQLDIQKINPYNHDSVVIPEEGYLLLWESRLSHGYYGNQSDNRISLSMNFIPNIISNGKYGFRIVEYGI